MMLCLGLCVGAGAAEPPAAWGPTPNDRQLWWYDVGFYGFVHFTVNTFTDREWGYGDESPELFDPTDFDADQIVEAVKLGGMKGLILTAKHHDGFCLWPSAYTDHNISKSPFRDGQGDLVKEIRDACRRAGLLFGTYISPWDRNRADYAQDSYVDYYHNQVIELMDRYGPIFEMWFDGANGGDGYYGGARETRRIPPGYYRFDELYAKIRATDPNTVIWGDPGADATWGGSEAGDVPDPCWPTVPNTKRIQPGDRYLPSEADVSIRPGWFYHAAEDDRVKSPAQLADIWFTSIGRGANLILNLPPDRRGQVNEIDVRSLRAFRAWLDCTFSVDLAQGGQVSADNVRGGDVGFGAGRVLDGMASSYWATDDGTLEASLTLTLPEPRTFGVVRLVEPIRLGHRLEDVVIEVEEDGAWREWGRAANVGARRLVRGAEVTTQQVRVTLRSAADCVVLSELNLYREAPLPEGIPAADE